MSTQEELTNTLVSAANADKNAEALLNQWRDSNFAPFLYALACTIGAPNVPHPARNLAAIYLKNILYAKSSATLHENHRRWKEQLSAEDRQRVKEALLSALGSNEPYVAQFAAQCASEIAAVELPYHEWPDFLPTLMSRVTSSQTSDTVQEASLNCLGFAAERIAELESILATSELDTNTVDNMLTTIVDGVKPVRENKIRLAAIKALYNSLVFVKKNMEVKGERDAIFEAICNATRCTDPQVRAYAYQCMDSAAEHYYDKLHDYMTVLYELTNEAIQNDSDLDVKMSAIEFWTTMASIEQQQIDEEEDCREQGIPLDRPPCPRYTKAAMPPLVPILLECLTKQDENEDEDEWNIVASAAVCLESISATVESLIVDAVMPFVEANIQNSNWRLRDAAIVAFACILEGPSTQEIGPRAAQGIPVLLSAFNDQNPFIVDSAIHCVTKICKLHVAAISPEQLVHIIDGFIQQMGKSPKLASRSCNGVVSIAQSLKTPEIPSTNVLSSRTLPLLQALMNAADRPDASECSLRVAAMSAASELVTVAPMDQHQVLRDFLPIVLVRIENTLNTQVLSAEDNEQKESLMGSLSGLVTVLSQRLSKEELMPHVDRIMTLLLKILSIENSSCVEEAMMSVGAVASAIGVDFERYLQAFMPFVMRGLRAFQTYTLCTITIGVITDMCEAVEGKIQPFCDAIMGGLREALQDMTVNRDVKPVVISCFGDIAMAIGAAYEPYLQMSVMLLMQAAQQRAPEGDEDLIFFINSLRLSILEAYSGIVMGLADGNGLHLLVPHVPAIMEFLLFLSQDASSRDEEVLQKSVALVGDIAQEMGSQPQVLQQLNQPFIAKLIQDASHDPNAREVALFANNAIHKALSQG